MSSQRCHTSRSWMSEASTGLVLSGSVVPWARVLDSSPSASGTPMQFSTASLSSSWDCGENTAFGWGCRGWDTRWCRSGCWRYRSDWGVVMGWRVDATVCHQCRFFVLPRVPRRMFFQICVEWSFNLTICHDSYTIRSTKYANKRCLWYSPSSVFACAHNVPITNSIAWQVIEESCEQKNQS